MKETMFILSTLLLLVVVIFMLAVRDAKTKTNVAASELHARDRYAVAEMIEKEMKEKQRQLKLDQLPEKQKKNRQLVF